MAMEFFSKPSSASSAIRIVRPDGQDAVPRPSSRKDTIQRQCKNVMIYGSCKFQDKGCVFYHPSSEPLPSFSNLTLEERAKSPSPSPLSAQAVNAPVFVPRTSPLLSFAQPASLDQASSNFAAPAPSYAQDYQDYNPYAYTDSSTDSNGYDISSGEMYAGEYDTGPMESFYPPSQGVFVREPLNYHLYTNPLPSTFMTTPLESFFLPNSSELRQLLQYRSELIRQVSAIDFDLPDEFSGYHTLTRMEINPSQSDDKCKVGNWPSIVYKAINASDGKTYVLRRVENYRLMNETAFTPIEMWSQIRHTNIVSVCEAFTTRAFNDSSLFVVYTYHPGAQTLAEAYLKATAPNPVSPSRFSNHSATTKQIPERTIWSYIIQIASAMKSVHEAGLAVRMIDVTKVLVTGKHRVRIGCCGLFDVLMHDAQQDLTAFQQEDYTMLGRLIFALCCNNATAASTTNLQKSIDHVSRSYSSELKLLALWLLKVHHKHLSQLFEMIGYRRIIEENEESARASDILENELLGELENARLVRLLCKLNFINERPGFAQDPKWSESGDKYIVKLFRDYVFHRVDENLNPILDLSHVLTCLNKLDAGSEEKMMLVARDEQSCLVVSYKEVKACIEASFQELVDGVGAATNYR